MTTRLPLFVLSILFIMSGITGCTTGAERRVDILYQPTVKATGGSGTLYIAQPAVEEGRGGRMVQWVLGPIKDRDGTKIGTVVSDIAPEDTVADAFHHELAAAGYAVRQVAAIPPEAAKGIRLTEVAVNLEEVSGWVSTESTCRVKAAIELWRDGKPVNRVTYQSGYTDTAVTDQGLLSAQTLKKALQLLMGRAVPEIVGTLEGR